MRSINRNTSREPHHLRRAASGTAVLALISAVLLFLPAAAVQATTVQVQGRQILVNGNPFIVKGVCYSPVPAGHDTSFAWGAHPEIYENDLPLIRKMGATVVRTYQEKNITRGFLDACQKNGLYVIVGWTEELWNKDFSQAATRTTCVNDFSAFVSSWSSHPAVLMWSFGNESEQHMTGASTVADWYSLLQAAAAKSRERDTNHPVTTANTEVFNIGVATASADDASLPDLGVWGINVYRGNTLDDSFFTSVAATTAKPFYLSEWGCDSWNGTLSRSDPAMQDASVRSQWSAVDSNLASKGQTCLGGTVFEWSDEWWKGDRVAGNVLTIGQGGVNGSSAQDTAADWPNGNYPDDTAMNEEWWGITSSFASAYGKLPKTAYYSLKDLWGGTVVSASGGGIFRGDVRNFPNPFPAGSLPTRIEFAVNGQPELEITVYDLAGREVAGIADVRALDSGLRTTEWSGKDRNGDFVAAGLYVCKIRARTSYAEETRYRKIAVVK